ncbi:MAG TPA: terminase family protein [Bryobacteraceae bacterium]|nr:terminase family protein [Bryobacteraceae bacterium]
MRRWDTFNDVYATVAPRSQPEHEIDAVAFARTRLGFEPDEKQAEVLASGAKRGILNCSRQWGKSTVTAAKAIHRAFTRAESLVLVASPSERQSAEFLRKASGLVRRLQIKPRGDGDNAISLLFPNGSRIVGLPGTEATVRGFSAVSMILIDEASRVPDELYRALRPMLAVGDGDLWMMSTPCGQRGFFYETWVGSSGNGEEWMKVCVKASDCPRISASFLDRERGIMTAGEFAQEYMGEFHGDGTEYFDRQLIEEAIDLSIPELNLRGRN